jgi:hypothetical protein
MKKDTKSYIPLHKLDEQPSIVEGGQMKDYQVRRYPTAFGFSYDGAASCKGFRI